MSLLFYTIYFFLNLGLLIWGIVLFGRYRRLSALIISAVAFGLTYDNLILMLGNWVTSPDILYWLSLPRFVLHQLLLPWIILAAFEQTKVLGFAWAQSKKAFIWMIILSMGVMLLGVITRLLPMGMQLTTMDGVTRYIATGVSGPPIVSIISIGFATVIGFFHWRKIRFPFIFLFGLLVFIGEGIPVEWVRRIIGSGAEVLFIAAMLWLELKIIMRQR